MEWSTPGFPVLHCLTRVCSNSWLIESVMLSNHLILCCPWLILPSIFPTMKVFSSESALPIRKLQDFGALASVLPVNIRGWLPLELTGLIPLLSKGLSRVFSSTTVQRHQFFGLSLFYCPALTSVHDYWRSHSLDCLTFVGKVTSLLFNTLSRRLRFWIIKFHLFLHLKCSSDRAFSFLWELRFLRFKASNPKISKGKKYSLFKIYSTHWNIESLQEAEWIQGYDFINCEMIVE